MCVRTHAHMYIYEMFSLCNMQSKLLPAMFWLLWTMLQWTWECGSLRDKVFISFGQMLRSGSAGSCSSSIFNIWGTFILFSRVVTPIYISINCIQGSLFSIFSPRLNFFSVFDDSQRVGHDLATELQNSNACEVVTHFGLICLFLMEVSYTECLFMYYWPYICLWKTVSVQVFYLFLNWIFFFFFLLLSCMSSLCIFDINPLSGIWLRNIFSHTVGCLFTLLMVSFAV